MRWVPLAVAAVTLGAGLVLFAWGSGPTRGLLGDVLVIVFLDACLAATGRGTAAARIGLVAGTALVTELVQGLKLVGPDSHWLLHLTLGSTFDPLDFAAYAVGAALALAIELRVYRRP